MIAIKANLRELVQLDPPHFHKRELTLWSEWKDSLLFIKQDQIIENDSVDLSRIVGHSQGYGKMTWEYMLGNLKRINERYIEVQRTPEYYIRGKDYYAWSFLCLDGAYFIGSGKHRTTIARYLAHYNPEYFPENKINGVTVTHYMVDKLAMDQFEEIKELLKCPALDHLEFGVREHWAGSGSYFFIRNPHRSLHDELRYSSEGFADAIRLLQNRGISQRLFGSHQSKYILSRGFL